MTTAVLDLGSLTRADALIAALGDVSGLDIVDVGCGEGAITRMLAGRGAIVTGYDPFIATTDEITVGAGRCRLLQAPADAIPQADGSADVVLFVFSLHHVPQGRMAAAIAEAQRLLRPGGVLCVAEPVANGPAQYVMAPYHDETAVRGLAIAALADHARPRFAGERVMVFSEPRRFAGFDAYTEEAIGNMRYNDYEEADVLCDEVRGRFDAMMAAHGGRFDQPVRLNLYQA